MLQPADVPRRLARAVRQAAVLALLMLLSLSSYLAVLKWRGDAAVWVTRTAWDRHIPFRPEWVWVYLLPYLVGPVVAGSLSRPTFAWFVRRGLAAVLASLAVFVVWFTELLSLVFVPLSEMVTPPIASSPESKTPLLFTSK